MTNTREDQPKSPIISAEVEAARKRVTEAEKKLRVLQEQLESQRTVFKQRKADTPATKRPGNSARQKIARIRDKIGDAEKALSEANEAKDAAEAAEAAAAAAAKANATPVSQVTPSTPKPSEKKVGTKVEADDESKITAKVGGKKDPKPDPDKKVRLETKLEKLNEKLDKLKQRGDDSPRSPEDAYKLLNAGREIAEIIGLKYEIAKGQYLYRRSQDDKLTPEQKAELDKDIDDYFSHQDNKEKWGALGEGVGSYLGPLGGVLGRNLGEFGATPAKYISKGYHKIIELKNDISNFISKSGASNTLDAEDKPSSRASNNEGTRLQPGDNGSPDSSNNGNNSNDQNPDGPRPRSH